MLLPLAALALVTAEAQVRAVPDQPASAGAADAGVTVYLLNEGDSPATAPPPERIEVTAADGTRIALAPDESLHAAIAAGGFARLRYRPVAAAVAVASGGTPARETVVATATGVRAADADRFRPHEPIYGVFGTGDAGAKLQVSFAFQPFDTRVLEHLRFAYTQTMFWAIDQPSGPFRATTYTPEVYADVPVGPATSVAFGYRHDSNGRGGARSVSANRLFVGASHVFDLGGDWRAAVSPRAWVYVGPERSSRGIGDYLGHASLTAAVYRPDGLKLSATLRGSPDSGRGAGELYASYPLAGLGGGLGIYLFGQGFTGYGEAIEDFRVRDTHARLGIALTR